MNRLITSFFLILITSYRLFSQNDTIKVQSKNTLNFGVNYTFLSDNGSAGIYLGYGYKISKLFFFNSGIGMYDIIKTPVDYYSQSCSLCDIRQYSIDDLKMIYLSLETGVNVPVIKNQLCFTPIIGGNLSVLTTEKTNENNIIMRDYIFFNNMYNQLYNYFLGFNLNKTISKKISLNIKYKYFVREIKFSKQYNIQTVNVILSHAF